MRVCSFFCAYEMKERTYGRLSGVTTRPEGPERGHFKGVFTQMHRNNAQGLLRANISLLLEKLHAWGMTARLPHSSLGIRDQTTL